MDDKFRSRRWILTNRIFYWSLLFSGVAMLIGVTVAKEHVHEIIGTVFTFMGATFSLIGLGYLGNRAVQNWKGDDQ